MTAKVVLLLCLIALFLILAYLLYDHLSLTGKVKNHKQRVYHALYDYAEEKDALLLSDVYLYLPGDYSDPTTFDHLLFHDKYVYVISDFAQNGGLYGNIQDPNLYLKPLRGATVQVPNPVSINEEKTKKLEEFLQASQGDHLLVSVVVYNDSLVVPETLRKKNQDSWFISLSELTKTIKQAEKDNVTPIPHEETERIMKEILSRSNAIKQKLKEEATAKKAR